MIPGWKVVAQRVSTLTFAFGTGLLIHVADLHATPEKSREFYSDAVSRVQKGDRNAAIVQLRNALQQDPQNLDARFLLGELYFEQGDFAAAEREIRRVHEVRPNKDTTQQLAAALLGLHRFEDVLATVGPDQGLNDDLRLLRAEALLDLARYKEARTTIAPVLQNNPLNVTALLLSASLSLAQNDLEAAGRQISRAVQTDPKSARAWVMKTQLAVAQGDLNEALAAAERTLELAPGDRVARLLHAEVLLRRGELDKAEPIVREVLADSPTDVAGSFLLASIEAARTDFAAADRILRPIQDATRDVPRVMFLSAVVKAGLGQDAQAKQLLGRYLARVPQDLIARRRLAILQLQTGEARAAQETLRPVTGSDSRDVPSLELLSSAEIRQGDLQAATQTLQRINTIAPQGPEKQRAQSLLAVLGAGKGSLPEEARQPAALVLDHLRLGEGDAGRKEAEALAQQFSNSPVVLNLLGVVRLTGGEDDRAREAFERAVALDPQFLPAISNLERLDLRANNFEGLERRLRERMMAGPAKEEAAIRLAQVLASRNRREEAVGLLRKQAENFPESTQIRIALAALARDSGHSDLVLETAEQLMSLGKAGDPAAYQAAGSIYLAGKKLDKAAEAFQHLVEALPNEPQPKVALARTRYLQGRTADAEALLEQLRASFPNSLFVNNSLVDLALERGKIDAALAVVERLQPTAPELAALLHAKVLVRDKRAEEAAVVLANAMAKTPSSQLARQLFLVRMQLGHVDDAIASLNGWIANHPDDAANLELLSSTYIQKGEYAPALLQLERAVQFVPNNPVILNNLSWLRYELGHAGAREMAQRAHQIAPNSPEISDTLGWILVRDGDLDKGLALLREASQNLKDNADVSYHLAYALSQKGKTEAAQEILRRIVSQPESFMERGKAEALLKQIAPS